MIRNQHYYIRIFNDFAYLPWEDTKETSPSPKTEIPKQKLLVKGPGYLLEVCGWDMLIYDIAKNIHVWKKLP